MRPITRIAGKHGKIWHNDKSLLKMTFISDFGLLISNHKNHITDCKWNNIPLSQTDLVSRSGKDSLPIGKHTSSLKKDNVWPDRKLWLSYINISVNHVDWNILT